MIRVRITYVELEVDEQLGLTEGVRHLIVLPIQNKMVEEIMNETIMAIEKEIGHKYFKILKWEPIE